MPWYTHSTPTSMSTHHWSIGIGIQIHFQCECNTRGRESGRGNKSPTQQKRVITLIATGYTSCYPLYGSMLPKQASRRLD